MYRSNTSPIYGGGREGVQAGGNLPPDKRTMVRDYSIACTISSVIFLASPKSIIVLSLKNSGFCTPA